MLHTHLGSVPLLVASVGLFTGLPGVLYWVVVGFVFSFVAGIANSWVLLIEIMR